MLHEPTRGAVQPLSILTNVKRIEYVTHIEPNQPFEHFVSRMILHLRVICHISTDSLTDRPPGDTSRS